MTYNGDLYPVSGATAVMTTSGDLASYTTSRQRIAIGSANQILQVKSSYPSWETVAFPDTVLTTQGDILIENSSGLARLGQSTSNYTLATKGAGANPAWQASATSILSASGDILYASGANTLAKLAKATDGDTLQLSSGVPAWVTVSAGAGVETGSIIPYGGAYTDTVSGYLQCNGSAVSRTTYSDLFGVTSTQFGVGDGSSTFNLPNFNSKFARGAPSSTSCGATGGADTVSLSEAELASHTHSVNDSGHVHDMGTWNGNSGGGFQSQRAGSGGGTIDPDTDSATTGISLNTTGSGTAHQNMPAYLEILYIIKT